MDKLKNLLLDNEQWLMERILFYAKRQNYSQYTSTLVEAWRLSISGLTGAIVEAIDILGEKAPEFMPDDDYTKNPIAEFGITEARLHRRRGINLGMFLGLLKYYRQAYQDLVREKIEDNETGASYGLFIVRCFDLIEIALSVEWNSVPGDEILYELQNTNRLVTNEKNRYLTLFESLADPVFLINEEALIENLNMAAVHFLELEGAPGGIYYGRSVNGTGAGSDKEEKGEPWKELIGKPLIEVLPWLSEVVHFGGEGKPGILHRELKVEKNGISSHYMVTLSSMLDVSGRYQGAVVVVADITDQIKAREALLMNEERLSMALEATSDGMWDWNIDTGETYFSPRYYTMLGYEPFEFEPSYEAWRDLLHPEDIEKAEKAVSEHLEKAQPFDIDFRMRTKAGPWRWILGRGKVFSKDPSGKAVRMVGTHMDITERRQMEEEIRILASTDPLTGANNRRSFMEKAEIELNRSRRYSRPFSVLMIDIDHFKNINDKYGHQVGDLTLQIFTETCLKTLRENDLFGRMGGEEFAAVLVETEQNKAVMVADRLRRKLSETVISREDISFNFQVSIGVAPFEEGDKQVEDILRKADQALYKAKSLGRNRVESAAEAARA